ncbi:MAG: hypothetical protein ACTSRS_09810 [Candidatus Helarchaeota archaeon]
MRVWITTVGWQPFAVINPVWAACFYQEFVPEKIILLNNGYRNAFIAQNVEKVQDWHLRILRVYGVETPVIETQDADEDSITTFRRIFEEVVKTQDAEQVAIDMTPGRKFMSSIAMVLAFKYRHFVKRLFYLHLWGQEYQNLPFIKIPLIKQRLINVLELY